MARTTPSFKKAMFAVYNGKRVGSGVTRMVYRTGYADWVYKFDNDFHISGGNKSEYAAYLEWKNKPLPAKVFIPEMVMVGDGVLAVQYIKGKHPEEDCNSVQHYCDNALDCWATQLKGVKIEDLHCENVIQTKSNDLYIIDLGYANGYD